MLRRLRTLVGCRCRVSVSTRRTEVGVVATYNFGTLVNPAHFVEIPDPAIAGQTIRPPSGTVLRVRNALTLADLPNITTTLLGYWSYATTDVPLILVSGDNWATSVGPLAAREAFQSSMTAAVDATTALATANTALATANAVAAQLAAGGGGTGGTGSTFTGTVDWNTQVTNKPTLTAAALGALATSAQGAAEGVAALSGGLVPIAQLPVGTGAAQVASGAHTHAQAWSGAPAGSYCRVDETSAGVYPAPATTRADIVRVWRGSIRPTAAQGLQAGDEWRNTGA